MNKESGVSINRRPLVLLSFISLSILTSLILAGCGVEVKSMSMDNATPSPVVIAFAAPETPVVLVLPPTPTSTPLSTATPIPTSTPAPTSTPYPTVTPLPTATPVPTATPLPTNTPLPTSTPYPTATRAATSTPYATATTTQVSPTTAATFEGSLMSRAADKISEIDTLHFVLEIRAGKVSLSGAELQRAEGDLKRPDNYQASVKLKILFASTTVKVVAQDGVQQMTDPITGKWSTSGAGETLNLAAMLDARSGIGPVLKNLKNLKLLGTETVNGTNTYHVQGTATAAQTGQLTFNNLGKQEATIDAWIGQSDDLVRQLYLKENSPGNGFWALTFSNFNQPVSISK